MQHISESISINAAPEAVWRLLTTPDLILRWFAGIDSVEASADFPAVGSTISGAYSVLGIQLKATQTVQAMQPNQSIAYTLEGVVNGSQRWEIVPTGGRRDAEPEHGLQHERRRAGQAGRARRASGQPE